MRNREGEIRGKSETEREREENNDRRGGKRKVGRTKRGRELSEINP